MNFMGMTTADFRKMVQSIQNIQFRLEVGTSSVMAITAFVFMAIGLYTIAKKRCIRHPWLAWIPVANLWLLGCVSDQYRYVTKNQERTRRKRMLTLAIIQVVNLALAGLLGIVFFVKLGAWVSMGQPAADAAGVIGLLCGLSLLILPLLVVSIWLLIEQFCAYYDLFSSCNPENKTVFTVLSIVAAFFGYNVLGAIFVFICRNKEAGMPPRIAG